MEARHYFGAKARIIETTVNLPLPASPDGSHTLTLRPMDPGVVFFKVIVDNGGYESTFLKMPESPYRKQN